MRATNEKLRQNARHAQLESIYNASHCDSLTARLIAEIAEDLLMNLCATLKINKHQFHHSLLLATWSCCDARSHMYPRRHSSRLVGVSMKKQFCLFPRRNVTNWTGKHVQLKGGKLFWWMKIAQQVNNSSEKACQIILIFSYQSSWKKVKFEFDSITKLFWLNGHEWYVLSCGIRNNYELFWCCWVWIVSTSTASTDWRSWKFEFKIIFLWKFRCCLKMGKLTSRNWARRFKARACGLGSRIFSFGSG